MSAMRVQAAAHLAGAHVGVSSPAARLSAVADLPIPSADLAVSRQVARLEFLDAQRIFADTNATPEQLAQALAEATDARNRLRQIVGQEVAILGPLTVLPEEIEVLPAEVLLSGNLRLLIDFENLQTTALLVQDLRARVPSQLPVVHAKPDP